MLLRNTASSRLSRVVVRRYYGESSQVQGPDVTTHGDERVVIYFVADTTSFSCMLRRPASKKGQ